MVRSVCLICQRYKFKSKSQLKNRFFITLIPGGAGYSNQMKTPDIMTAVLSTSKELLLRAKDKKSKDFLLDKYTLRYIKHVDIEAALSWFEEML